MSERNVWLCLISIQLSVLPPGSGNEPGEPQACSQAKLETEMQVSRGGERWGSLCASATLILASPDALAPKDCTVGQVACLKVALCSLWECLLPGTAVLVLFPVPCTVQALAGKDSSPSYPQGKLMCAGPALSVAFSGGTSLPAAFICQKHSGLSRVES